MDGNYLQSAGRPHHLFAAASGVEWRHSVLPVWRLHTLLWQKTRSRESTSEEETPLQHLIQMDKTRRYTLQFWWCHIRWDDMCWPLITGKKKGATCSSRSRSKMWCMKAAWSPSVNGTSRSVSSCSRLLWKRLSRSSLGRQGELWGCCSCSTATGKKEETQITPVLLKRWALKSPLTLFLYFMVKERTMYLMLVSGHFHCRPMWVSYLCQMRGRRSQPAGTLGAAEWGQTGREPCGCCPQTQRLLLHAHAHTDRTPTLQFTKALPFKQYTRVNMIEVMQLDRATSCRWVNRTQIHWYTSRHPTSIWTIAYGFYTHHFLCQHCYMFALLTTSQWLRCPHVETCGVNVHILNVCIEHHYLVMLSSCFKGHILP